MKYIQDQEKRFMTSLESNEERLNSAKNAAPNLPKFSGKSAPKIFTPIIAYTYAKITSKQKVQRTLGIAFITAFIIILSFVIPFTSLSVFITRRDFMPLIILTDLKSLSTRNTAKKGRDANTEIRMINKSKIFHLLISITKIQLLFVHHQTDCFGQ